MWLGYDLHMLSGLVEIFSSEVIFLYCQGKQEKRLLHPPELACPKIQSAAAFSGLFLGGWVGGDVYFYSYVFFTLISSGKHFIQFSQ
jgi:hypothetical protein